HAGVVVGARARRSHDDLVGHSMRSLPSRPAAGPVQSARMSRVRGLPARLASAVMTLLGRDVAVVTNAIAFNFLLCLFPLMLVLVAVAHQIGDSRRAGAALLVLMDELVPFDHQALANSIRSLGRMARTLEVFSVVLIVWGSSGIFVPVEMALNRVW